jgi:hypothetical protein
MPAKAIASRRISRLAAQLADHLTQTGRSRVLGIFSAFTGTRVWRVLQAATSGPSRAPSRRCRRSRTSAASCRCCASHPAIAPLTITPTYSAVWWIDIAKRPRAVVELPDERGGGRVVKRLARAGRKRAQQDQARPNRPRSPVHIVAALHASTLMRDAPTSAAADRRNIRPAARASPYVQLKIGGDQPKLHVRQVQIGFDVGDDEAVELFVRAVEEVREPEQDHQLPLVGERAVRRRRVILRVGGSDGLRGHGRHGLNRFGANSHRRYRTAPWIGRLKSMTP